MLSKQYLLHSTSGYRDNFIFVPYLITLQWGSGLAVTNPGRQYNSICNSYGHLACEIPGSV